MVYLRLFPLKHQPKKMPSTLLECGFLATDLRRFGGSRGVECSGSISRFSEAGTDEEDGIGYV